MSRIVVFDGYDAAGNYGLWVTNGSAAGTYELAGVNGVYTGHTPGWVPGSFAVFGAGALFGGFDAAAVRGLWMTNGTAAGTYELNGITGASATFGVDPQFLTAFNGEALFSGYDAAGQKGLWVTNGAGSGTHELSGISGAYAGGQGLAPTDITVFNGIALFIGADAAGQEGLWVTNGTAAGTSELTGVGGAYSGGLYPSDITVLGGEVLFEGQDATANEGLWVTDGTVAGTYELIGISGVSTGAGGLVPNDITVLNGEALFQGQDAAGKAGLWVTNGTAAGTRELTGISGAYTGSVGLSPSDLTALNGEALFAGLDTAGDIGLWVTNGTASGTHELTGIVGADPSGLDPTNMTLFNGEVLFQGKVPSGSVALWVTDGTAAGTHELTGISGAYTGAGGFPVLGLTALPAWPTADFNGDGKSDILLQNSVSVAEWLMNGAQLAGGGYIDGAAANLSPGWSVAGIADFNGDGVADMLLQDAIGGGAVTLAEWLMNGTQVIGGGTIGTLPAGWSVAGPGDFNGDGDSDILLQNGDNLVEWQMNGVQVIGGGYINGASPNLSPGWSVAGIGDFNGDGKSDILLQNGASLAEWQMNGTQVVGGGYLDGDSAILGPGWSVAGVGDFNGDGNSDLLLQAPNGTGGTTVAEWLMNGTQVIGGGVVGTLPTGWSIAGVADFNGDGKSDFLLRDISTGAVAEWLMNGAQVIGGGVVGTIGSSWSVQ